MEQNEIDMLIQCEKKIKKFPKKFREVHSNKQMSIELESCERNLIKFLMSIRVNCMFEENFSVILTWKSNYGNENLLRCNCKHPHKNKCIDEEEFDSFHIHSTKKECILNGAKIDNHATPCDEYADYRSAISFFIDKVGIIDIDREQFDSITAKTLFSKGG